MPSIPPLGSVTVCEINRELIIAERLSDDGAKDSYGKLLGMVFSPIPFEAEQLASTIRQGEQQASRNGQSESVASVALLNSLQCIASHSIKRFFCPHSEQFLPEIDFQGVSWHPHKHIIAFISSTNQLMVRDYEDLEAKDACILSSGSQRDIKALEWRPNGGKSLSVACKGGICIWAASYPGNAASVRPSAVSYLGTLSRGSGTRWTLVDFLRSHNDEEISALSWSPNGRYLASASCKSSSFTLWDVAQGVGTPIRRGLGAITLLKWSPTGDYFFAAKFDGTFYLWETNTWTSEPWTATSGFVTGASWDPDGHIILIAFSGSATLGSIYFASKPPSLGTLNNQFIQYSLREDAHLLQVDLPEIASLTGSQGIEKIAWDASGERLAVSYKGGNDIYRGLIAIYDVRRTPLISASLIGFIRGPGDDPKPTAFAFHNKFKQGPLLSVCWSSGCCCTYPLLFQSHSLP